MAHQHRGCYQGERGQPFLCVKKLLTPTAKVTTTIKTQLTKKHKIQKQHYDKSSKLLSPLTPNQVVRLQTQRGHDKIGVVSKVCAEPRSYVAESGGKEYRRNRQHLLPVSEPQPENLAITQNELDTSRRADETEPNKAQTNKRETIQVQLDPPQLGTKQSEQVITPTKCQVRSDDNLYRTRSGRVSKPNSKYVD